MSRRNQRLYLSDVLDAGKAIEKYVEGYSYQQFAQDRKTYSAVIREFEIIGEAVGKLSEDIKSKRPDIPWQNIKDLRNLLIHEYFGVDLEIIWLVIEEDLPNLIDAVTMLLNEKEGP